MHAKTEKQHKNAGSPMLSILPNTNRNAENITEVSGKSHAISNKRHRKCSSRETADPRYAEVKRKKLPNLEDPTPLNRAEIPGRNTNLTVVIYRPVRLGGEVQLRNIWSKARVHSATHAVASFSTPAAVGVRPPHITGFTARRRACRAMSPL